MKRFILLSVCSLGLFCYGQTQVTSNKDGTPDNHGIMDTATVIQTHQLSSKRLMGIGKNVEVICTRVQTMIDEKIEPVRVSDQKFKKD